MTTMTAMGIDAWKRNRTLVCADLISIFWQISAFFAGGQKVWVKATL
ncbi:hypothetical protein AM1_E0060 (plasmid) [Acaryochloris marina MBIC11017]|uniref:Uncharacterized protein n=1 Tax=Acaryochloris marina (strain MBIC 11017) TaxID=329726 RepID=A8ZP94_ACAM1|nr:hypothetical protein AM1_E0060 [Acaryochloris marina MBIC11017]